MDETKMREFILESAAMLVQEGGADHLTLDHVAAAAGLPPDAVSANFPDLESLVVAMVDRLVSSFHDAVAEACGDDESPGCWLRAYVRIGFERDGSGDVSRVARALLSSIHYRPHFVESVREREVEIQDWINRSGIAPERGIVIRAAMEGIFLSRMLGIELIPSDLRQSVEAELVALTCSHSAA
jgi:AcrR family transcriptional regulator